MKSTDRARQKEREGSLQNLNLWKCCHNLSVCSTKQISCIIHYTIYLFCRTPSDIHIHLKINGGFINGCGLLQMTSYRRLVAVVTESIRCLGQETEQYKGCSPEFNLK